MRSSHEEISHWIEWPKMANANDERNWESMKMNMNMNMKKLKVNGNYYTICTNIIKNHRIR